MGLVVLMDKILHYFKHLQLYSFLVTSSAELCMNLGRKKRANSNIRADSWGFGHCSRGLEGLRLRLKLAQR